MKQLVMGLLYGSLLSCHDVETPKTGYELIPQLFTEKGVYYVGEPVGLHIGNNENVPFELVGCNTLHLKYAIIKDEVWVTDDSSNCDSILAGSYGQIEQEFEFSKKGNYRIVLFCVQGVKTDTLYSNEFKIVDILLPGKVLVQTTKENYSTGEQIVFKVINTGGQRIFVPACCGITYAVEKNINDTWVVDFRENAGACKWVCPGVVVIDSNWYEFTEIDFAGSYRISFEFWRQSYDPQDLDSIAYSNVFLVN